MSTEARCWRAARQVQVPVELVARVLELARQQGAVSAGQVRVQLNLPAEMIDQVAALLETMSQEHLIGRRV